MRRHGRLRAIGFFGTVTLVLVVLKLTGNLDWSWWVVLSPLLAEAALVLSAMGVISWGGRKRGPRRQPSGGE